MRFLVLLILSLSFSQDLHALDFGKYLKKLIGVEEDSGGRSSEKETNDNAGFGPSCWEEEIKSAGPITGMPRGSSGKRIICGPTFYGLWAVDEVVDEEILTEEQMMVEAGIQRRSAPVDEGSEPSKYQRHHIRFPKREYSNDPWHTTYVKISGPTMRCGTFLEQAQKERSSRFQFFRSAHAQSFAQSQGPLMPEERRTLAGYLARTAETIRNDGDDPSMGIDPDSEEGFYVDSTLELLDWMAHEFDPDTYPCQEHSRSLCDGVGYLEVIREDLIDADGTYDPASTTIRIDQDIPYDRLPDVLDILVHEGTHALNDFYDRGTNSANWPTDLAMYADESSARISESIFGHHLDPQGFPSLYEREAEGLYRDLLTDPRLARLNAILQRPGYVDHLENLLQQESGLRLDIYQPFQLFAILENRYFHMGGFRGTDRFLRQLSTMRVPSVLPQILARTPTTDLGINSIPLGSPSRRDGPTLPHDIPHLPPRQTIGHRENLRGYDDPDRPNVMPLPVATNTPSDDTGRTEIDDWCWNRMPSAQGGPCERIRDNSLDNGCSGLRGESENRCRRRLQRRAEDDEQRRGRVQARQNEEDRIRQECERAYGTCERACQQVGSRERCGWVPTGGRRIPTPENEGGPGEGDDGDEGTPSGSDRPPPPEEAYGGEEGGDSDDCSGGDSDSEDGLLSIFFCW